MKCSTKQIQSITFNHQNINEEQIIQYNKKKYLQNYDWNQHIDIVRNKYRQRINKRAMHKQITLSNQITSNNQINNTYFGINSAFDSSFSIYGNTSQINCSMQSNNTINQSLFLSSIFINQSSVDMSLINNYQVEDDDNLPAVVQKNRILSNLYKKLDKIENNILKDENIKENQQNQKLKIDQKQHKHLLINSNQLIVRRQFNDLHSQVMRILNQKSNDLNKLLKSIQQTPKTQKQRSANKSILQSQQTYQIKKIKQGLDTIKKEIIQPIKRNVDDAADIQQSVYQNIRQVQQLKAILKQCQLQWCTLHF